MAQVGEDRRILVRSNKEILIGENVTTSYVDNMNNKKPEVQDKSGVETSKNHQ